MLKRALSSAQGKATSAFVEPHQSVWGVQSELEEDPLMWSLEDLDTPLQTHSALSQETLAQHGRMWLEKAWPSDALPAAAEEVLTAARAILAATPWLAANIHDVAQLLASRLPHISFTLRRANPGRPGGTAASSAAVAAGWNALSHTFLVAAPKGGGEEQFVVEPGFAAHFELAGASASYKAVLEALPQPLVTSPAGLHRLVKALQAHMAAETLHLGRSLAPWRSLHALLSKWFPTTFQDQQVLPDCTHTQLADPTTAQSAAHLLARGSSSRLQDEDSSSGASSPLAGPSPTSVLPALATEGAAAPGKQINRPAAPGQLAQQKVPSPAPAAVPIPVPPASKRPAPVAPLRVVQGFDVPPPVTAAAQAKVTGCATGLLVVPGSNKTAAAPNAAPPASYPVGVSTRAAAGTEMHGASLLHTVPKPAADIVVYKSLRHTAGQLLSATPPVRQAQAGCLAPPRPAYLALLPRCIKVRPRGCPAAAAAQHPQQPMSGAVGVAAAMRQHTPLMIC